MADQRAASFSLISFCVAHGKAQSAGTDQRGLVSPGSAGT